ncbi:glycosyltransferase family 2 protein [Raineyella sp. LH-20]|uniref:glycosyltransferase family 2 protein n=1 Tax=Raineyella sp. LH-20 TaxID=3081204 RepID=UPI0029548FA5|nr:glycosyltransferase [Raineyella sp. LH-20]WOP20106.1 glycosyltransferase [Raineyella sp. LH-20]
MTPTPDVSIVVPSRAGAARLPVLLRALEGQSNRSWEAVIVLDGDIDDSEQVLASYAHLPVRTIVFPENRGRVSALNAGFEAARGRILARCDDDLEPGPHYVARLIARHHDEPVGVVGIYLNSFPDSPYARVYGRPSDTRFRSDAYAGSPDAAWRYWAGNVSVTRGTYDRVGPYDSDYRAYGWEDVDWGFRLHEAGVRIVLAPELATPHHAAAQSVESRAKRAFHSGAARRIFEAKHGNEHLPAAIPPGRSPWNVLVRAIGRLDKTRLMAAAERLDGRLGMLPDPLARKLVALTVEGSAVSGYVHADQARADF